MSIRRAGRWLRSTASDEAMRGVQARGAGVGGPAYAEGAVLALITWAQRDDPHWFGARVPDKPQSVEFVQEAVRDGRAATGGSQGRGLMKILMRRA